MRSLSRQELPIVHGPSALTTGNFIRVRRELSPHKNLNLKRPSTFRAPESTRDRPSDFTCGKGKSKLSLLFLSFSLCLSSSSAGRLFRIYAGDFNQPSDMGLTQVERQNPGAQVPHWKP